MNWLDELLYCLREPDPVRLTPSQLDRILGLARQLSLADAGRLARALATYKRTLRETPGERWSERDAKLREIAADMLERWSTSERAARIHRDYKTHRAAHDCLAMTPQPSVERLRHIITPPRFPDPSDASPSPTEDVFDDLPD